MVTLKDKVVVITGASSGVGKAAAIAFAKKGAKVVLAARRSDKLEQVCNMITHSGGKCLVVQTDVTQETDVANLFRQTLETYGRVDILMNNAGRGLKSPIDEISNVDFQSVLDVNVTGVFLCTKEAVKIMKEKQINGHIITTSSIAGRFGAPLFSAYCASKHAITGLMKSIRWELRKNNIKCSTIHPARIDTEFFDHYDQRPGRGQMITARDLADLIIAVAQRNRIKILAVMALNFCKRIYYFGRYFGK